MIKYTQEAEIDVRFWPDPSAWKDKTMYISRESTREQGDIITIRVPGFAEFTMLLSEFVETADFLRRDRA